MKHMEVLNELVRIKQKMALMRQFPDLSATLEFDAEATCGFAWTLDEWMQALDQIIEKMKE